MTQDIIKILYIENNCETAGFAKELADRGFRVTVVHGGQEGLLAVTGIAGCCARAPSGHAVAAAISDMNSRLLIAAPQRLRTRHYPSQNSIPVILNHYGSGPAMSQLGHYRTLRPLFLMSASPPKADIAQHKPHVR
jgi:hypothetical protein